MRRLLPDWLLDPSDRLDESLWFLPIALTLGSLTGSAALLAIDHYFGPTLDAWLPALALRDPEAARGTLAVIGSSIITLTGVVFSITIVALTLASQQFGPRLLRTFMRDRSTQLVLGTFVATFQHTLIVRHALDWAPEILPRLSIHAAVLLAACDALLLVFFIHHVARSIYVGTVVRHVADEFGAGIDALCVPASQRPTDGEAPPKDAEPSAIRATQSGYLRVIQFESLVEACRAADAWMEVLQPTGTFVLTGAELARLHGHRPSDEQTINLRAAFVLGDRRTAVQDLGFSVDQLVELALRALSPGINDPETAIACVHRLSQGLARLADETLPDGRHFDDTGALRVTSPPTRFDLLVHRCFDRIARAAADHPEVGEAILAALRAASEVAQDHERARILAAYEPPSSD